LILLSSLAAAASGPSIRFERLSLEEGLPQSTTTSIITDPQDFLWVGTQDGLARYDGYSFEVFKHNIDDPPLTLY
jgi:ligand-binding sensor domain-containing protein